MTATAPAIGHEERPLSGALLYLGSLFLMAVMSALVKWLGGDYPLGEIILFRSLFAFVPIAFMLVPNGGLAALKTARPRDHLIRAGCGLTSMGLFYYALTVIPLADATMIFFSAPLLVAALSGPLLMERVGWRRWAAVVTGLVGVAILMRPVGPGLQLGAVAAAASAVTSAIVTIWLRKLSRTEASIAIVVYYHLLSVVVAVVWVALFGWRTPTPADFALLALLGLLSGVAQYAMTVAFRYAQAATLAPFEYSVFIHAAIMGLVIWGEPLTATTIIGGLIIATSGIFVVYREAVVKAKARRG